MKLLSTTIAGWDLRTSQAGCWPYSVPQWQTGSLSRLLPLPSISLQETRTQGPLPPLCLSTLLPSPPQRHRAELLQQVCACPHWIRELTSNPWINMGWEGMCWGLLSSWHKTNSNRTTFLCNTKSWGLGGKINILNCIWKPTSTKEKLALRDVVALSNL